MPKATRAATDWEAVELLYRPGVMSLRAIAAEHNCTEGAIRKRAKQYGWTRDLSAKVRAKADELVRKAEVRSEVRSTPKAKETERQQVDASAQVQATVILKHRSAIGRQQTLVDKLLAELEAQVGDPALFEQLGDLMEGSDDDEDKGRARADKLNEIYRKVISLPGRMDGAKKLAETLEKLVKMEREAFGLNAEKPPEDDKFAAFLRAIAESNTSMVKPVAADPEHQG